MQYYQIEEGQELEASTESSLQQAGFLQHIFREYQMIIVHC